jgi:mannose-6-phosphate isomerase-like protein (cupin superfamily)
VSVEHGDWGAFAPALAGEVLAGPRSGLVVAEWRDPGGEQPAGAGGPRYIAPLHVHFEDEECWYVLEGTLRFRLGEREVEASAGGAVLCARGTAHTYWNPRVEPARYLLVMTPRIHRLIEALHGGGGGDVGAVFAAHASEFLGWP